MTNASFSSADIASLERIQNWALRLDAGYRIPGLGIYIGWDPVVGLVPLIGDAIMAGTALRLVADARKLGISDRLAFRMFANVAADFLLGAIPLVGPILDTFFRANVRNLQLLLDDIARRHADPAATQSSV